MVLFSSAATQHSVPPARSIITPPFTSEHDNERLYRDIRTTEDPYPEPTEYFKLRIGNQDNTSDKTECFINILDDDGPGAYGAEITSTPADGDTYGPGEVIEVTMQTTHGLLVYENGFAVVLRVGEGDDNLRHAAYAGETGVHVGNLVFRYTVKSGDFDEDGVSMDTGDAETGFADIPGERLGNNIVVQIDGDWVPINRAYEGIDASATHKVDARPRVTDVSVVSTPEDGHTYRLGESIEVDVTFNQDVQFDEDPVIRIVIDEDGELYETAFDALASLYRDTTYDAEASTASRYRFSYTVKLKDKDVDGISIAGETQEGKFWRGGTASAAAEASVVADHTFEYQLHLAGHQVDGHVESPRITSVTVESSPANGFYVEGSEIDIVVKVDQAVRMVGGTGLRLEVGSKARTAFPRWTSSNDSSTLRFRYTVAEGDLDADGITLPADGLIGMNIHHPDHPSVQLVNEYTEQRDLSGHRVDGGAPGVTGVAVVSTPANDTGYRPGESIEVDVTFEVPVTVNGDAGLKLKFDKSDQKVTAAYAGEDDAPVSETIRFAYEVRPGNIDDDGLTIRASGIGGLGAGAIVTSDGSHVSHRYDAKEDLSDHKVDGRPRATSVEIVSSPDSGDTYFEDEVIRVRIPFDQELGVEGDVSISLQIGDTVRTAEYDPNHPVITFNPEFIYTVQADDYDGDGIEVLNGFGGDGFIFGQDIPLDNGNVTPVVFVNPSSGAIAGHNVGALPDVTAPTISSVAITSDPGRDDKYSTGDAIQVTATFSEDVIVTGTPQLELDVGGTARTAGYSSTDGAAVVFSYTVVSGDADDDGIAIGENKLTLKEGSIQDDSENDATLTHDAVASHSGHQVDTIAPTVSSVAITSDPGEDGTYTALDVIQVTVTFSENVTVTETPQLELDVGGTARTAVYTSSGSGANLEALTSSTDRAALVFRYTVLQSDCDEDGIAIGANKLTLNGGTIRDGAGNDAVLTHDAVADGAGAVTTNIAPNPNPKQGDQANTTEQDETADTTAPTISSIAVTSDAGEDNQYGAGDRIEITVTFSENVAVTGSPQIELNFYDSGSADKQAGYESVNGATVVFAYTVAAGDSASDGLEIEADKLTLNGGSIQDAAGNDAVLTHDAYGPDADHRVEVGGL